MIKGIITISLVLINSYVYINLLYSVLTIY